jgi:hypothetical protein
MVEALLLGDNPFIGVSHLSQSKARLDSETNTLDNCVEVFKTAVDSGATGFTFSTHPNNLVLLQSLKKSQPEILEELDYFILTPYAAGYVKDANQGGTPSLVMANLKDVMNMGFSNLIDALFTLRPEKLAGVFMEREIKPYLKILPEERVKGVLLHEVLTELVIAFNLTGVIQHMGDHLGGLGIGFGLESRNMGQLCQFLSDYDLTPEYIMTPLNPLGYQMAPSREKAENAMENLSEISKLIAINILASGAIPLEKSLEYLARYWENLFGVTVASSKPWRIQENFTLLGKYSSSLGV